MVHRDVVLEFADMLYSFKLLIQLYSPKFTFYLVRYRQLLLHLHCDGGRKFLSLIIYKRDLKTFHLQDD